METDERTSTSGDGNVRWAVGDLPAERLEAEIVTLAERLSAGTYELLVLVGELDARGTWAAWGALSCAGWLATACDLEVSTARTQVRVARAMRAHPELDAAMRSGDVSYAKARVLVPHLTKVNAGELVDLAADAPAGALGARLADHAVTRLLDDAFVSLLLHDAEDRPIDASPRRRSPTRRQRRVLDERHPSCGHPGCRATAFLQYDHIHP